MARLSKKKLLEELESKGYDLSKDSPKYKNLSSPIKILCKEGHLIETNLKTFRSSSFRCPQCEGITSRDFDAATAREIDVKNGYRVLGIDNATQRFGVSIYENGKLIFYRLLTFNGADVTDRLNAIRDMVEKTIIPVWEPDFVQFEDVQLQGKAFKTYEVLVKLIGLLEMSFQRYGIPFEKTRSNIWRSHHAINGGNRKQQKEKAIKRVREMYGINVGDDVAEAILIAKYRVDLINKKERKDLF